MSWLDRLLSWAVGEGIAERPGEVWVDEGKSPATSAERDERERERDDTSREIEIRALMSTWM
jgi:hypothetical protein